MQVGPPSASHKGPARLGAFKICESPRTYKNTGGSQICSSVCGYSGSLQFIHQLAAGNRANRHQLFFRPLERLFLEDGLRGRGRQFAPSQSPQPRVEDIFGRAELLSSRAARRAAIPRVKHNASQGSAVPSCAERSPRACSLRHR